MVLLRIPKDKRKAMLCKMFLNSLKRPRLTWCYGLKLVSVDSFGELSKNFQWYSLYAGRQGRRQTTCSLWFSAKRCMTLFLYKHMMSYTQQFYKEMLEVLDCHNSISVQAFRRGLVHESPFYDSLTMRNPLNMVYVLQYMTEFIKLEDGQNLTKRERSRKKTDWYCEKGKTISEVDVLENHNHSASRPQQRGPILGSKHFIPKPTQRGVNMLDPLQDECLSFLSGGAFIQNGRREVARKDGFWSTD